MKLRNKKTGSICEAYLIIDEPGIRRYAGSIKDLCNEYEDYKPTEPLIKDEKVRKAVRAWAEAESEDCYYGEDAKTLYNGSGDHIEFWGRPFTDLKTGEHYTIAELCGEEEE